MYFVLSISIIVWVILGILTFREIYRSSPYYKPNVKKTIILEKSFKFGRNGIT